MSIWQRPRDDIGPIGETVPEGLIRADELISFTLPAAWGKNFQARAMEALPDDIPRTQALQHAIENGKGIGTVRRILGRPSMRRAGGLETLEEAAGADFTRERIPAPDWEEVPDTDLVYLFYEARGDGIGEPTPGKSDPSIVVLDEARVDAWLDTGFAGHGAARPFTVGPRPTAPGLRHIVPSRVLACGSDRRRLVRSGFFER